MPILKLSSQKTRSDPMTTFIQIHTLTSHSTHCLNRDDIGQPKTLQFHGRNHGRTQAKPVNIIRFP